jgi:hypothetical protein
MGYGEFGTNGSLHWKLGYDDVADVPPDHQDYDTIAEGEVGHGSNQGKGHKGFLQVRLRFQDKNQAIQVLTVAANAAAPIAGAGGVYAFINVPAVKGRKLTGSSKKDEPLWEVRVDW